MAVVSDKDNYNIRAATIHVIGNIKINLIILKQQNIFFIQIFLLGDTI